MKGPGYKLSGDLRGTWRCPKCGRERKGTGEVTTIPCACQEQTWMEIVVERLMVPRPVQRPSDIERRPVDFGIEPPPPAAPKPEATIIKSAISDDVEPTNDVVQELVEEETTEIPPAPVNEPPHEEEEWGEGIL